MTQTVKQILKEELAHLTDGLSFDVLTPPDPKLGDYSTNAAFILGKKEGKKPVDVASEMKEKLANSHIATMFDIQVAPNGFLNFFAKLEFLQKQLDEISKDEKYGENEEGKGKKVIVEYSSPNIAKPMHIGHLRSTIIGDSLANVYDKLGYEVIRWNYIGDWGTQFGKLIAAWKKWGWGDKEELEIHPIREMLKLYVKFHDELKNNPDLEKEGQKEFKKLENSDVENREIWERFRKVSIGEFTKTYTELSIGEFQITKGESDYEPNLKPLIEELQKKDLAKESEGALIIELENMPPMMLRKTDGATLYATRDIASLEDRITNYHPDKILYVVANQQALHFEQLFAVAKKLDWTEPELVHVKFGMVLGEDGKKLATREGKVVPLQEVIDKVTDMARDTVKQKNSDLSGEEMDRVAHVVAIGALKYNDLKQHPYSDIEFDWKAMLDLSGNSGPYIQYTYARLQSILHRSMNQETGIMADTSKLNEPSELRLMRQLLDYPEAIQECAECDALNGLALYLYDLAHLANQFYEQVHVLEDNKDERPAFAKASADKREARLLLIQTVSRILKDGLGLLGIETLERI